MQQWGYPEHAHSFRPGELTALLGVVRGREREREREGGKKEERDGVGAQCSNAYDLLHGLIGMFRTPPLCHLLHLHLLLQHRWILSSALLSVGPHLQAGAVSNYINGLRVGDTALFKHVPQNVKLQYPFVGVATITMLAVGVGIAPMIQALYKLLVSQRL
jgi:hypothetical protein